MYSFSGVGLWLGSKMAAVFISIRESEFFFRFFPAAVFTASPAQRVSLVIFDDGAAFRAVEISVDVCVWPHDFASFFWILSL
jgi:hypothetical protein